MPIVHKELGYLAKPSVGGRAGNPPLFGESAKDGAHHIAGAYSAKARAKCGVAFYKVLKMVRTCNLVDALRQELMVRQAFHIFEMNGASNAT
jgi:hypothetical protein